MLKMTIDNEEVVSKNNFTIKEEMLSPSSTILNNTYPKTWEDDKNYTSRFYYPKDYAKLDIQNFSITPEEAGTTIDIVGSATLTDVDTTKESRVLSLKGQTSQTGTPTPTSPIPINVVSGDNEINICGKNLFNANEVQIGKAWNGTNNSARAVIIIPVEQNVPYTISMNGNNSMDGIYVSYSAKTLEENYINGVGLSQITTFPRVYTSSTKYIILQFNKSSVSLSDIENLKLQVEKGSTASTYEPYIGNSYPIYLGVENLLPTNEYIASTTINGITYTNNGDGTFSLSGTATANTTIRIIPFDVIDIQPNQAYYLYSSKDYEANTFNVAIIGSDNGTTKYLYPNNTNTFTTTPTNLRLQFYIASGKSVSATNVKMYLIKGTKLNHLSTTPIELCKIGDYQDYIYKDNGSWYLHKEIGKVVLDGSESGWSTDSSTKLCGLAISDIKSIVSPSVIEAYSNYYKAYSLADSRNNTNGMSSNQSTLWLNNNSQTLANFKTWLNTHNTTVYYVLATPTTTLITDTNLLEQLDDLESQ